MRELVSEEGSSLEYLQHEYNEQRAQALPLHDHPNAAPAETVSHLQVCQSLSKAADCIQHSRTRNQGRFKREYLHLLQEQNGATQV